ncbi:MAG TPA: protein kinase [Thermoanaerobaculia bacterium]|nr:protein kinase [Thermoanaerobaculia bacterium]
MLGTLIGGHIRILDALGQGGMGEVYVGRDERLDRRVAVKAVRADRERSGRSRERVLREARALSALDHPNICRLYEYIEAPEGDFLILELIEGVTLTRAVERGMSRTRKLRIAADVLAALIAAHRKGIVHRDLKPDNVMITPDGGVKVLDFGIARLEEEEEEEQPHFAGTPRYMSPEQAAGGDVTTASDLYSFGLLLQMLLTESAPENVPLTGERRDMTALVNRLRAPVPVDRPSAAEALTALHRILDAPKRRLRFAAAALALLLVVAAAVRYTLDVTAARDEARHQRRQAEELVAFMVGDLRQKLEGVGRLDVLDGVASRALAYFASLRPEELTGADLDHNARALAQLGDVREHEGKLPEAIALFRQSARFASAAVARKDAREEWELTLSNAYFELGDAYRRQGNVRETLRNFQAYFDIAQRLAQRHPADLRYQAELSYGHGNLGAAHEAAGDVTRALREYRRACELDRERLRRAPHDEQWQGDLANSVNRLGVVLKKRGDLAGARRAFDEDLQIRRRLAAASPRDVRRQERLATSLAWAGTLQQAMGDDARARASYREEAALTAKAAQRDPDDARAKRNHAVAQMRLATLLPPGEGLPLITEAVDDLRAVVRTDARAVWRRDLTVALVRVAQIRSRLQDAGAARRASAEALAASEALAAERPEDPVAVRSLCESLLLAASLDEDAAAAARQRTRAAELAASAIDDPDVAATRVRALIALDRRSAALPLIRALLDAGYRETSFVQAASP